jgi:hypothetical protein
VTNDNELYYFSPYFDDSFNIDASESENDCTPKKLFDNVKSAVSNQSQILYINEDDDLMAYGYFSECANPSQAYVYEEDGTISKKSVSSIDYPITVMQNVDSISTSMFGEVYVITKDKELYIYGYSYNQYLGEPVDDNLLCTKPTKVMDDVAYFSNYGENTAIITENSDLYINSVEEVAMTDIKYAYPSNDYTFAINNDGELYKIGDDETEKIADNVVCAKGTSYVVAFVDEDGSLYTCG